MKTYLQEVQNFSLISLAKLVHHELDKRTWKNLSAPCQNLAVLTAVNFLRGSEAFLA